MVGAVGEKLGFHAEALVPVEVDPSLARVLPEEVGGIHLHAGQIGPAVHGQAAAGADRVHGVAQAPVVVQHEVVIHAPADFQLGMGGGQGRADGLPLPEIEGCSLHRK